MVRRGHHPVRESGSQSAGSAGTSRELGRLAQLSDLLSCVFLVSLSILRSEGLTFLISDGRTLEEVRGSEDDPVASSAARQLSRGHLQRGTGSRCSQRTLHEGGPPLSTFVTTLFTRWTCKPVDRSFLARPLRRTSITGDILSSTTGPVPPTHT